MDLDARDVAQRIIHLVEAEWPTTETERIAWFEAHDMNPAGEPDEQRDLHMPWSKHFGGPAIPGWGHVDWRFHRDEFVGLLFMVRGSDESVTRVMAEELRDALNRRWQATETLSSEGGFTSYWLVGGCQINMYFHPPQQLGGHSTQGTIQLHVDHAARAAAEELQAVKELDTRA